MEYIKKEKIQLDQTGYFWGNLSNLTAGALEVDIDYPQCPFCKYDYLVNEQF